MMNPHADPACPTEVLDWIAWYPEGRLPESIRGAIESHAAECAPCRDEIGLLSDGGVAPPVAAPDPARVYERVRQRIAGEAAAPRAAGPAPLRPRAWPRPLRRRAPLAAGLAFALLAAGALGFQASRLLGADATDFQTVTAATPVAPSEVVQLDVVLRPEVTFGRIEDVLVEVGASLASGPTRGGVLRLNLPPGSDARAVAEKLREGRAGIALFAEPIAH